MNADQNKKLKKIDEEVLALEGSELDRFRRENGYFPVIGEGSHFPEIMFIGEAPGEKEAKSGKPFCGRSGKILDELLISIEISREEVYITSIVKDRPPKNRDPKPEEIELYAPFLDRQIEIMKPKVIATLGRFSMEYIMKRYGLESELGPISNIHGRVYDVEVNGEKVKFVPLYHPAAAIYNQKLRSTLFEGFNTLKDLAK